MTDNALQSELRWLMAELNHPASPHDKRAEVGVRLAGNRVKVRVGWRVSEGRKVGLGPRVRLGVELAAGVGKSPSTVNLPEIFQFRPTKI